MDPIKHFYYFVYLAGFARCSYFFGDANSKNASGGMVADRRLTSWRDTVSFLVDMQVRTHHHRHHHHHVTSVSADGSGQR
jgi:hypothetical protein